MSFGVDAGGSAEEPLDADLVSVQLDLGLKQAAERAAREESISLTALGATASRPPALASRRKSLISALLRA